MTLYEVYFDNQQAYEDFDKGSICFSDLILAKRFYESCNWQHVKLCQYDEIDYYNTKKILAEKKNIYVPGPDYYDRYAQSDDFSQMKLERDYNEYVHQPEDVELLALLKSQIESEQ